MKFSKYLDHEWVITWGCTEPAAIAYAVALAAGQAGGAVDAIELTVDPRMYKNCYAVGIPHSGHKTGIFMAASGEERGEAVDDWLGEAERQEARGRDAEKQRSAASGGEVIG